MRHTSPLLTCAVCIGFVLAGCAPSTPTAQPDPPPTQTPPSLPATDTPKGDPTASQTAPSDDEEAPDDDDEAPDGEISEEDVFYGNVTVLDANGKVVLEESFPSHVYDDRVVGGYVLVEAGVGSDSLNAIVLSGKGIMEHHAEFVPDEDTKTFSIVEDDGEVTVDGKPVDRERALGAKATLQVGAFTVKFELEVPDHDDLDGFDPVLSTNIIGSGPLNSISDTPGTMARVSGLGKVDTGGGRGAATASSKKIAVDVQTGDLRLSASCVIDTTSSLISFKTSALAYCYEKELRANPKLAGEVVLDWRVGPTGATEAARVSKTTLNHPATEGCLLRVVKRWRFDPSDPKKPCEVTLPVTFKRAAATP